MHLVVSSIRAQKGEEEKEERTDGGTDAGPRLTPSVSLLKEAKSGGDGGIQTDRKGVPLFLASIFFIPCLGWRKRGEIMVCVRKRERRKAPFSPPPLLDPLHRSPLSCAMRSLLLRKEEGGKGFSAHA